MDYEVGLNDWPGNVLYDVEYDVNDVNKDKKLPVTILNDTYVLVKNTVKVVFFC